MMDLLVTLRIAVAVVVVIVTWRKVGFGARRRLPSPSCGGNDTVIVPKELLGMTHSSYGGQNWQSVALPGEAPLQHMPGGVGDMTSA